MDPVTREYIRRMTVLGEQSQAFLPLLKDVIQHTDWQSVEIERLRRLVRELEAQLLKESSSR
ncbi:hypothetical protein EBZ80_19720 [bacterium]|nr:hypothetical protein [bacterium]